MSDRTHKENWYNLDYHSEGSECGNVVLQTSLSGFQELRDALARIDETNLSRILALDVKDSDDFYSLPFTHVEILPSPPEDDSEDDGKFLQFFMILGVVLLVLVMLAGYGFFQLLVELL